MNKIILMLQSDGSVSVDKDGLVFDNENLTVEVELNYPEEYESWNKRSDIITALNEMTFREGDSYLLDNTVLKKGLMKIQPIATQNGSVKKWNTVTIDIVDSINALENDATVTESIAEVMMAMIDTKASVPFVQDKLDEKADLEHTHNINNVVGLQGQLNQKATNKDVQVVEGKYNQLKEEIKTNRNPFRYDDDLGEYINIDKYWDSQKNGRIYTSEFYHFDVTPNPDGVKKDDNIGLEVIPSTATEANRDDYDKIGLFKSIDVNAYVDEDGDYHVTAIKGDGRFKNDGTNGDVYVMSMVGYQKRYSDDEVWGVSYSDTMHPEFEPLHEAVKIDGSIRPYLLHAKYIAGINPKDGYLASISGVTPDVVMSHNHQITKFRQKGSQYSGKTSHDDYYVQLMFWLKYATTHSQSVLYGATSAYYLQYDNRVEEVHVKRAIITNGQANNLLVGSTVSIGDYAGDSKTSDRNAARTYNVANRVNITSIEDIGGGNSAVYVDADTAFDTTLTTTITTYPYNSGYCDSVLGRDGSPVNPLSGKEPFVINGIEMMIGAYEVLNNFIIQNNAVDDRTDVYVNYDCTKYHTSITANYDLVGQILTTDNVWKYISKLDMPKGHPSVLLPIEGEASSSMGFADGVYSNPTATGGTRQWLSLGFLYSWRYYWCACAPCVLLAWCLELVLSRSPFSNWSKPKARGVKGEPSPYKHL